MKYRCEAHENLDLARLRRDGVLKPGATADLKWSGGLKLDLFAGAHGLTLRNREGWSQTILYDWTATRFGGRRQWLSCPKCQTPRRVLYFAGLFACRVCLDLRYESDYEKGLSRVLGRIRKLESRLREKKMGAPHGRRFPLKPHRMHWRTYRRLLEQEQRLITSAMAALGARG